jgi:hypothetical protein
VFRSCCIIELLACLGQRALIRNAHLTQTIEWRRLSRSREHRQRCLVNNNRPYHLCDGTEHALDRLRGGLIQTVGLFVQAARELLLFSNQSFKRVVDLTDGRHGAPD